MNELELLKNFVLEHAAKDAAGKVADASDSAVSVETPKATADKMKDAANKGKKVFDAATPSLSDIQVPKGGIGMLLAVGLLIVFAIVPAPGQNVTRLSLIWKAITGGVSLGIPDGRGTGHGPVNGSAGGSTSPLPPPIQGALGGALGKGWF